MHIGRGMCCFLILSVVVTRVAAAQSSIAPGVLQFGDRDRANTGAYTSDPTAGATLLGLSPGVVTTAPLREGTEYPIATDAGDFAGSDRIFVGDPLTSCSDGYCSYARDYPSNASSGPQVFSLDFGSLIPAGRRVTSLTLGLALVDFQFPAFSQPFIGMINGTEWEPFSAALNSIDTGGPLVQFRTIGLPTSSYEPNVLTIGINNGGTGGDAWAIDFLTLGFTTESLPGAVAPEPVSLVLLGTGLAGVAAVRQRKRRTAG